jgi:hypothetical protein
VENSDSSQSSCRSQSWHVTEPVSHRKPTFRNPITCSLGSWGRFHPFCQYQFVSECPQ